MSKATGQRLSVRLALLQPNDPASALLFEAPPRAAPGPAPGPAAAAASLDPEPPPHPAVACAADAAAGVTATQMGLDHTLLVSAVAHHTARFVKCVQHYLQVRARAARACRLGEARGLPSGLEPSEVCLHVRLRA
jgi:hypothetical protein